MKRLALAALLLVASFGMIAPVSAADNNLSERLKGYLLLSAEEHGEIWYVYPESGARVHFRDANAAWSVIKSEMIGISNADLSALPLPGQEAKNAELRDRLAGKFLLAVDNHGEVWYVNPHDGYRHYLGTGESTYEIVKRVALGITKADLASVSVFVPEIPSSLVLRGINEAKEQETAVDLPPVVQTVPEFTLEGVQSRLDEIEFTDAEMAWDFASSLYSAYGAWREDIGHYVGIEWFENVLEFNIPVFMDESGFTLNSQNSEVIYWVWTDFSDEFFKMYYEHVNVIIDDANDTLVIGFTLPSAIETPNHGLLEAGDYFFTSKHGLLTQEEYENLDDPMFVFSLEGVDVNAEAERIVDEVDAIIQALRDYSAFVGGAYPELRDNAIVLGENGRTRLTENGGFHPEPNPGRIFLTGIKGGGPTSQIFYDSALGGDSYVITFTLYGSYSKFSKIYTPGVYEATPIGIRKVADIQS